MWHLNEIEGEGKLGFSFVLYPTLINGGGWPLGLFWGFFSISLLFKEGKVANETVSSEHVC